MHERVSNMVDTPAEKIADIDGDQYKSTTILQRLKKPCWV